MPLVPTSLVTGGAGFLGSHSFETGALADIERDRSDSFAFAPATPPSEAVVV